MRAARWGKTDIVVELVKEGADIDMQNEVCCLFLHLTLCMRPHYPVRIGDQRQRHNAKSVWGGGLGAHEAHYIHSF